jgi:hypothetical protein
MTSALPPRIEALAARLSETQTTARGAIEVLWRDEVAPLVEAGTELARHAEFERRMSAFVSDWTDALARLERTP